MTRRRFIASVASLILLSSAPALSDPAEDESLAQELIHSDLPLFSTDVENIWPQHFSDADGSFGCTSRVAFGDWRLSRIDEEEEWWRIGNYGVFHCALTTRHSSERERLASESSRLGFAIRIGEVAENGKPLELWALQIGTVPGSDYVLLSREANQQTIKSFNVLQRECPERLLRTGATMDTFRTSYCAINSRSDLIKLAQTMAHRRPLGKLEWVGESPAVPE